MFKIVKSFHPEKNQKRMYILPTNVEEDLFLRVLGETENRGVKIEYWPCIAEYGDFRVNHYANVARSGPTDEKKLEEHLKQKFDLLNTKIQKIIKEKRLTNAELIYSDSQIEDRWS